MAIAAGTESFTVPTERRRARRQTTGRRYPRELLMFHREWQLGCSNDYGWGAQFEQHATVRQPSQSLLQGPPPGLELVCAVGALSHTGQPPIGNDVSSDAPP